MNEQWRAVIGFKLYYEVSNLGRVRNLRTRRIITPFPIFSPSNYLGISLYRGDWHKRIAVKPVHHLVTDAWLGPLPSGMERNHKDGNKHNNTLANLEFVSRSENLRHAYRMGLRKSKKGCIYGPYKRREPHHPETVAVEAE